MSERRDLPAEVGMLSDLGRSYMVNWLSFAEDEAEREIIARAIDKAHEYEADIARLRGAPDAAAAAVRSADN